MLNVFIFKIWWLLVDYPSMVVDGALPHPDINVPFRAEMNPNSWCGWWASRTMVGEPVEPWLVSLSNNGWWACRTMVGEPVEPWLVSLSNHGWLSVDGCWCVDGALPHPDINVPFRAETNPTVGSVGELVEPVEPWLSNQSNHGWWASRTTTHS